ncbi:MAG: chromosomal replication initiator protein DnaA [Desulfobacterales bacterium]
MNTNWNEVKNSLKAAIPLHRFQMWIEPLRVVEGDAGYLTLACPNTFFTRRVQFQYGRLLEETVNQLTGLQLRIQVQEDRLSEEPAPPNSGVQLTLPEMGIRTHSGRMLRRDFTFDQFVVGQSNDFAYSASLSLACRKTAQQNCLYLLSGTGMGKTHLSQAIGHHIMSREPKERVYYMTAEDFSNEMVHAFRHDCMDRFKGKYRDGCDVLLLEDVHYLTGKDRTQVELAMTLDNLLEAGKKIIFSSCFLPGDIPKLDDKLRSRLGYGLVSSIEPPSFQMRVKILKRKARKRGVELSGEVAEYLAGELTDDIRQLESGLIGVTAKSSLLGCKIDLPLAESVVRNIIRRKKAVTIDSIKRIVCKYYGIKAEELTSRSRRQSVVRPRQMAMFLSRRYTDSPLETIGRSFNRYHATVLHSINAIEKGTRENTTIREQVSYFKKRIEAGKI